MEAWKRAAYVGSLSTPASSLRIFGVNESEPLLAALFLDRFGADAGRVLDPFLGRVGRIQMPFDLLAQTRKHEYPGYADYEQGLPTVYYYFVPGSGWESESAPPSDPLESSIRSVFAISTNLGTFGTIACRPTGLHIPPMVGALPGKAREQLGAAASGELNVLAVTGIAPVSDHSGNFAKTNWKEPLTLTRSSTGLRPCRTAPAGSIPAGT